MTVEKILLEFDAELKNLLPVLKKINAEFGYVGEEEAQKVADYFSLPLSKVYETASFYDLINTKRQPPLMIQVCSGANCAVKSAYKIISEIENQLHIKAGDDFNPNVKLEIISCLGQCGRGPIMIINKKIFTQVTPSSAREFLHNYM
ncbi:MAG: NADH-quinone oxidoreductase, E subunit [Candidatus Moranbacteria bacterium GW2011_GWA2_39_41]|nr:MAG: NADH-quinone oxidoreductase, E subunit [Candidatus Moranbacteria bacterium GW2011_GWA2_39_41]